MRRFAVRAVVFCALLAFGCGKPNEQERQVNDQEPEVGGTKLQKSIDAWEEATAVAESKDPAARLAAWQRDWIRDGDYSHPRPGVFETQRDEFRYRWTFAESDVVLTVSERPDADDENKDLLYLFVTKLMLEWRIEPLFIYSEDAEAGDEACANLIQAVIDEAIRIEETTSGAVYPDAFPESKAERIAMMKGPNRTLAASLVYKTLLKSGTILSGGTKDGDVFSFRATAEFSNDGKVTAKLFVNGK